jgi:hypothetical protein
MLSKIINHVEKHFFLTKEKLAEMINDEIEFSEDWRKELQ